MLQVRNLKMLSDSVLERHQNFVVGEVNESCLRIAVNEAFTYEWHRHPDSDEMFMVLEGELRIEYPTGESWSLRPGDVCTVPRGQVHRTRADARTVNLCFEHTKAPTEFV